MQRKEHKMNKITMKTIVGIGAVGIGVISVVAGVNSGNVVGYQTQIIHKGQQELTVPFRKLPTGRPLTVGDLLADAIEGDSIAFGDFSADAVEKGGELHWVRMGKVVDGQELPAKGGRISYFRSAEKKTTLALSGEAAVPEVNQTSSPQPQAPRSIPTKHVEKPEQYLADYLSYSTVSISNECAGFVSTGTGFFFNFPLKSKPGKGVPAIVTNKHVMSGATNTVLTFTLAGDDGRPSDRIVRYRTDYPEWQRWIGHPSNDVDLCILPLLPIERMVKQQTQSDIFKMAFDLSFIPDDKYFSSLTQLDDVAMIGYPNGYYDSVNNQPIFRKGAIATRPSKNYMGKREYLVDMSVFRGSSGSPVLLVSEGMHFDRASKALVSNGRIKLIGVVYAVHLNHSYGDLLALQTVAQTRLASHHALPNNLGLVIHASRMIEMADALDELYR